MSESASRTSPEALLEHREWLRAIARSLVRDENAVDDAEQRTWLVALRNRRPVTSVRGWLRRVVRSSIIDEHRAATRRAGREAIVARPESLPPTDHLVAQADAQRVVAEAVTKLDEPYRTTVLLRYFEELPLDEVAARMGVPLETVRTRLKRAHARLREALDGEFGDRRAWTALLIPLTERPRVPLGPVTAGAAAMATKAKLAAVVVLALAVAGGTWWAAESVSSERDVAAATPPSVEAVGSARSKPREAPAEPAPEPLEGFTVGVDVVDTSGRPVVGARVEMAPDATDPAAVLADDWYERVAATSRDAVPTRTSVTSGAGAADVIGVPAGEWRLSVLAGGFATHRSKLAIAESPTRRRVVLRAACVLAGTVVRADGSPAAAAEVVVGERRARADEAGRYRFDDLTSGVHDVLVGTRGVVQQTGSVSLPAVTRLDLRLHGGCALRGRVLDDETGAPIAGARVVFRATVLSELPRQLGFGAETTTGENGTFSWDDLPAGTPYFLWAMRDGYPAFRDGLALAPPNFHLVAGLTPSIEVRMRRGGVVRGRVLRPDGSPVPGAVVDVLTRTGSALIAISDSAVSAEDGAFRVLAVTGTAMIRVRLAGTAQRDFPAHDPWVAIRDDEIPASCRVEVSTQMEAAIDVVVEPDGRLRDGVLAGVVRRDDGLAAADVVLELLPVRWGDDAHRTADPSPSGAFRFEGLASRRYVLRATANGCVPARVEGLLIPETGTLDGVEVVLLPGRAIAGRVLDSGGAPVVGASIVVSTTDRMGRDGPSVATTGADGAFVVGGLAAGDWLIRTTAPGLVARDATFAAGRDDVEIRLDRSLSISGVIVDAASGEPLAGVPVQATWAVWRSGDTLYRESSSDAAGRFVLTGLVPDRYTLWAGGTPSAAPEYIDASVPNVVAGATDVRIAMTRGLAIEGRVLDEAGDPVRGGWMAAYGPKAGPNPALLVRRARIERDGSFRLPGLAPGAYDVEAGATDVRGKEMSPVRLADVQTGSHDVVLRAGSGLFIEGRVVFEDGTPVPPAVGQMELRWKNANGGITIQGAGLPWGRDGRFRTNSLAAGVLYDVVVLNVTGRLGAIVRGVRPGTSGLDVIVLTGGRIEGRVLDASGNGVAGVPVSGIAKGGGVWPPEPGSQAHTTSDGDGRFSLSGLADRPFFVSAGGHPSDYVQSRTGESVALGTSDLEIRLERGVSLSGRLVDAKGAPCKAGQVQFGPSGLVEIGQDGRFVVRGLKPGTCRALAHLGGRRVDLGEFQAPADGLEIVVREE